MAITIYSNISSLTAQRRLGQSTADLRRSFERLSSGLRINRAADDAAGLAIAENLNMQSRVYAQGVRNLNDGISALQIADSAVAELTNVVTRIRELSERSANGTITNKQRAAINEEAQALSQEVTRIIQTTEFNGANLLSGDYGDLTLQAGFGQSGTVTSSLGGNVGSGTFSDPATYTTGGQSRTVSLADVNGDGLLDVLTANFANDSLGVLLGNGDGTLQAEQSFAVVGSAFTSEVGDVNGDGILDAVLTSTSGNISVLIGNGDGTFNKAVCTATALNPAGVALGDLNGDGQADIVVSRTVANDALILISNGDGTFAPSQTAFVGSSPRSVAIADFNGDGALDVATANLASDSASVMLGNGDGTFGGAQALNTGGGPTSVAVGDVNGDGIEDLIAGNYNSQDVSVLVGNGDGTFATAVTVGSSIASWEVAVGDLNGDGLLDIATAGYFGASPAVLLGNGDGTFDTSRSLAAGGGSTDVAFGDFDNDGVLDVVFGYRFSNSITVGLASTTAGTAPILPFSLETQADALQSMAILDRKLSSLGEQRAKIGAFISRVETAINVTSITAENLKAAESQIRDADIAFESAELVRKQILQQAGAAVLTQANQQPQIALQLLGGI